MKQLPSSRYLHQRIDYNPVTGKFIWCRRPGKTRGERWWNTMFAGNEAGSMDNEGYRTMAVDNSLFKAHRLAWKMTYGEDPIGIDHANGDKSDNRIVNLREATNSQNSMNRRRAINCTSGYKGVCWNKRERKWMARIEIGYQGKTLGYFQSKEDAKLAYDEAAIKLFGDFARFD